MNNESVWIVDDDSSIRWVLQKALQAAQISCLTFDNPQDVLRQLQSGERPQTVISDVRMPQMDGMTLLQEIHRFEQDMPVIIMTAHSDLDSAVGAYQSGAFEYLPKPFDIDEAITLTQRALAHRREQTLQRPSTDEQALPQIVGEAPAMQEVFRAIGRLSHSSINVLINGQSGTGKELVAHALHQHSPRSANPFIALNVATIAADLVESELFGHEKGAFTGAQSTRHGRFEQAHTGTLFLDEIGDMPIAVQTRLLRVLAEGQFYRVGGHQPVNVDVRIIAATHQNLEQRVREGQFREDLFHRLNVIRIHIPSLTERREDIPLLASRFLRQAALELKVEPKTLSKEAQTNMMQLSWPGNVRQLENVCRWLTVMASGQEIFSADLPQELYTEDTTDSTALSSSCWPDVLAKWADEQLSSGKTNILVDATHTFEKILLQRALKHSHGHKQDAARLLGWGRNTLTRKLKELNTSE